MNTKTATLAATAPATMASNAAQFANTIPANQAVRNVVLVHGAFADGSGWRGVYDDLAGRGYRVTIVQNPLTSLADDVAATNRILDRQTGPTVLVGHSYGGTVITEAGVHPRVTALVYVFALAPDVGETTGDQFAEIPAPPEFVIETENDGYGFVDLEKFKIGFAGDTTDAEAAFLRDSQTPINMANFGTPVTRAARRDKPSWAVVATGDKAIDPRLLRSTAARLGAFVTEVAASHVPFITHPGLADEVIDAAARGAR